MSKGNVQGQFGHREGANFFPTPVQAVEAIVREEAHLLRGTIWEPACGTGHMSETLKRLRPSADVVSSDIEDMGYGEVRDFLDSGDNVYADAVITNPPYRLAQQFIERALDVAKLSVIMLGRLEFVCGQRRHATLWSQTPPTRIWVHTAGLPYFKDGDWVRGGAFTHAWYVWDLTAYKGRKPGRATQFCWLPDKFDLDRCDP